MQLKKGEVLVSAGVDGCGCRALSFQAAAEEVVVSTLCRCVVD